MEKGLFREDLEYAKPEEVLMEAGNKWGIRAKYKDGTNELLSKSFDSKQEAQKEIEKILKDETFKLIKK